MNARFVAAAAVSLAILTPAIAQAQAAPVAGPYVNLGYAHATGGGTNFETLGARLGYRIGTYFGVEGEGAFGVQGSNDTFSGVNVHSKLSHEFAGYGVGFLPIGPNTDILARAGYGTTKISTSALGSSVSGSNESWNFGAGVQHHFDGVNGIRVDYTRQEYTHGDGHANVFGAAYVRRF